MNEDSLLSREEINALGNALLSEVFALSIPTIRTLVGAAGMDTSRIPSRSEEQGGSGSRAEIVPVIQKLFAELSTEQKLRALPILAERTVQAHDGRRKQEEAARRILRLIGQHGFDYQNGNFIPVGLLDEREAQYQPRQSYTEIAAAFERLARGDESGAITKACGAVESLARAIYEKHGWTDLPRSFKQE